MKDPMLFNYIIMALYVANAVWQAYNRKWADAMYWISAFSITATVTWGYTRT